MTTPPTPRGEPIILHMEDADPDAPLAPYEPNMIPERILPTDFPFPIAEPRPEPVMVTRPCGCTSMVVDGQPVQISWCADHESDAPWPPVPPAPHMEDQ